MSKPPATARKALALATLINATMRSATNGDFKLLNLKLQTDRAMKVYSFKNKRDYIKICNETFDIWKVLATKHNNILEANEVALFTEMLCSLIPKSHFKQFFNINPYTTVEKVADKNKSSILMSVLDLDRSLNENFGTPPTTTRESLGLILSKPIKSKRVKSKKREVVTPKRIKKLRRAIKYRKNKSRDEAINN